MKKELHPKMPCPANSAPVAIRSRPMWIVPAALVLLALALPCCSDGLQTSLGLTVEFSMALDQLEVTLQPEGEIEPEPGIVPKTSTPLASGLRVLLLVPDSWDKKNVTISVAGLLKGKEVAHGKAMAMVYLGEVTDVLVKLAACSDACVLGASECMGDQVRKCEKDVLGCVSWSLPQACPTATPYCSSGVCSATCKDECTTAGTGRCATSTTVGVQVCGQHDSDSCLEWGPVLKCQSVETCLAGKCMLSCGGKPCPCTAGQTKTCQDIGECKGGVRKCISGSFGPCEWTVGPSAEACDGKDNDCSGEADDGLVAPGCAKQSGVCLGSIKKCGGTAGWTACTASDYQGHASKQGLVYEAIEKTCDGKDNDCNGKTDEPSNCCQPACTGKACGADDGCGNTCQSGSCAANATCKAGTCVCDYLGCGSACCSSGQVCKSGACCTPDCTGRQCGLDPVCGSSCGTCTTGTCNAQGKCVTICTAVGPLVVDSAGDVGSYTSLGVDSAYMVHISYYDLANQDLKYATNSSGSWKTFTLDSQGDIGKVTSLGLDSAGMVHISYYDETNIDLKYVTNSSGAWNTFTLDSQGDIGAETSLGLDSLGMVHISYYDFTNIDLKYATNSSGAWKASTVDSQGNVGGFTSLGIDSAGKVHVSYYDAINKDLKHATNSSGAWNASTVDSQGEVGKFTSLGIDSSGKVHISYYDFTNDALKYATNASGAWQSATVDTAATLQTVGEWTSLGIDSSGKVHICYSAGPFFGSRELRFATNVSGSWKKSTVDSNGSVGFYTSLAVDSAGKIHISYRDETNLDLKYVALCQ